MSALSGRIALVTGASRGIGKGTALALAELGATVYVTGRTALPGGHALPGSLEETVAEAAARGGRAMAIPEAMTRRIGFWEKPLDEWEIWDTGLRAAFVCAWHAARIMVPQGSGLIAGLSGYVGVTYTYDVVFGTTKTATDRMMRDMAVDLEGTGVTALSLWQGFTYTERARENLKAVPGMAAQLNSAAGSSPEFPGRVIAALMQDPQLSAKSGGTFINAELAAEYGVTDKDGRTIPSLRETRGAPLWAPGSKTWSGT